MEINSILSPELIDKLQGSGYFILFILMLLEGPLVTIAAAFLASVWVFNIYAVAALGWIGDMTGDIIFFLIGKYWLNFFQKKQEIDTDKKRKFIERIDILIHSNFLLSLILIKITPYAPMIALPYLGKIGIPVKKYFSHIFLLSLPVPVAAAVIGFHIDTVREILQNIPSNTKIPAIIILVILTFIVVYIIARRVRKFRDHMLEVEKQANSHNI